MPPKNNIFCTPLPLAAYLHNYNRPYQAKSYRPPKLHSYIGAFVRSHVGTYRVFIKYCVFPLVFVIFLNSASSAAALVFYLPGVCVHTLTPRENRERPESGIFKNFKNTIFNKHPVDQIFYFLERL